MIRSIRPGTASLAAVVAAACAAVIVSLGLPAAAAAPGSPGARVTVLGRGLLGVHVEDMTYVPSGPYKGLLVMAIGSRAMGVRASELADGRRLRPVELFDFLAAGPRFRTTGLVYVPEWGRFVANNQAGMVFYSSRYLYLFSANGRMERRPVEYAEGMSVTGYCEGIAWVPFDAEAFPDDLRGRAVMIGYDAGDPANPRLDVFEASSTAFTVVQQIPLDQSLVSGGGNFGGVDALPDGSFVLTAFGDPALFRLARNPETGVWTTTREPISPLDWARGTTGESVVALPDGRLVMPEYHPYGLTAIAPAASGGWDVTDQMALQIGVGIAAVGGLAWDSARNRFLVTHPENGFSSWPNVLSAVPAPLTSAIALRPLSSEPDLYDRLFRGLTYDAMQDEAVVAQAGRLVTDLPLDHPALWETTRIPSLLRVPLADLGAAVTRNDLSAAILLADQENDDIYRPGAWGNGPASFAWLPGTSGFTVRFNLDRQYIWLLNSDGTPLMDGGALARVPGEITCPPGMRFRISAVAAAPLSSAPVAYAVTGACMTEMPATLEDYGPEVVVLLDSAGAEVARVDAFQSLGLSWTSHVTFVTSGKDAGALALYGQGEVAVFKLR